MCTFAADLTSIGNNNQQPKITHYGRHYDLFGSVYFTSDDISAYSDKQKRVLAFAKSLRGCKRGEVDTEDGTVTFTYLRNGKKTTAELSPTGGIHKSR